MPQATPAARPPEVDVFLTGLLFFDLVFTGLDRPPTPGIEVWSTAGGWGPTLSSSTSSGQLVTPINAATAALVPGIEILPRP